MDSKPVRSVEFQAFFSHLFLGSKSKQLSIQKESSKGLERKCQGEVVSFRLLIGEACRKLFAFLNHCKREKEDFAARLLGCLISCDGKVSPPTHVRHPR